MEKKYIHIWKYRDGKIYTYECVIPTTLEQAKGEYWQGLSTFDYLHTLVISGDSASTIDIREAIKEDD